MVRIRESVYGVQIDAEFGKWTVIGKPFSTGSKKWMAVVMCKCGNTKPVDCSSLASGGTLGCKSCHISHIKTRHNDCYSRLYRVWANMKARCMNPKADAYKDYGGRGISICPEWLGNYQAFQEWALANGYADDKQIDRYPNNDGNYEPTNCRFVLCVENQRNRRSNRTFKAFGETKCIAEWAQDARCVVKYQLLLYRVSHGWSTERALTEPSRQKASA